jgi:hypothetical protein
VDFSGERPFNANDLFTVTEAEPLLLIVIGDVGASRGGYPAVVAAVAGSGAARRGHTAGPVPPPPGPAEGAVREGLLVAGVDHLPCKTNTHITWSRTRGPTHRCCRGAGPAAWRSGSSWCWCSPSERATPVGAEGWGSGAKREWAAGSGTASSGCRW